MPFSSGIHVTSIHLWIGIVASVIPREKSILWACKNKGYFLQSIILTHTSVGNFSHVNTFFNHSLHGFELRFCALKKTCPYAKKCGLISLILCLRREDFKSTLMQIWKSPYMFVFPKTIPWNIRILTPKNTCVIYPWSL